MGRRSKVDLLPPAVKDELNAALAERAFSDYEKLAAWLAGKGYEVSPSSLQRHGAKMERRIMMVKAATEAAQTLVSSLPDEEGAIAEATVRLAQSRLFEFAISIEEGDHQGLVSASRAISELTRSHGMIQRYRREARAHARLEASEAAGKAAKQHGLQANVVKAIRAAIEGDHGGS